MLRRYPHNLYLYFVLSDYVDGSLCASLARFVPRKSKANVVPRFSFASFHDFIFL